MFWKNRKEIKSYLHEIREWMSTISYRMTELEMKYDCALQEQEALDAKIIKSLDKADDCLKNVEKLDAMINEFKGCVSIARAALEDRKKAAEAENKTAVLAHLTKEIYKSMMAFIQAGEKLEYKSHYKLDAIYSAVCENDEKEDAKKRRRSKKGPVSEDSES